MSGFYDQQDWAAIRPVSPFYASSENNTPAIRMVSYSPPRLDFQPSQYIRQPRPSSKASSHHSHSHSLSLPRQGSVSPTPGAHRDASRRQRQRQRKHHSHHLDDRYDADDVENGANDSDWTTTTSTSRRSKPSRPSSWAPAAALAAAVSAVTRASSPALKSPAASSTSSASLRSPGGSDGDSGSRTTSLARGNRHSRQGSVLSEKSANIMSSGKRSNMSKEAFASSVPEPALAKPAGAYIPSSGGVSKAKLASPVTTSATRLHKTTPGTPPANLRHIRDGSQNTSSSIVGDRPRARNSRQAQPQAAQTPESHSASLSASLSSARPRSRLGLPPASASFSAAAATYLTKHSSNISIAHSLADPSSPCSVPSAAEPSSPASPISAYSASPSPSQIPSSFPTNYSSSHPSAAFSASQQSSLPSSYQSAAYPSSSYPPPTVTSAASSYTLPAAPLSHSSSSGSLNSASSSQAAAPRPHSRRRNIIAVHSDKTFSLVPRGGPPQSQQPPSAVPALAASLKSPPSLLSFGHSFASSTVRSSSPQDRLFSYATYNSGDRPGSPVTTAASTILEESKDLELFESPSSWSQRLVGGLRSESETPAAKGKGKERADTFVFQPTSQERVLSTLPETASQKSTVFAGPSTSETTTGVNSRSHKKKQSSVSAQSFESAALSFSASTLSANTNYKVYARGSSPPVAHAGLELLDSFADLSLQDSRAGRDRSESLCSSRDAHLRDTTNIEILGVSSPPASPLPELRRNSDPDQSFASFSKSLPSIASFDSEVYNDDSTLPNFVVLGASSPPAPNRYLDHIRSTATQDTQLDVDTDIDISSSPPLRPRTHHTATDSLGTFDSDQNYVLHGEPSSVFLSQLSSSPREQSVASAASAASVASAAPAPPETASSSSASSLATVSKPPRQIYSRESLVVQPLKTLRARRSHERLGYYTSRSRESLRRAASLKSISSIFNQEAASTFFAGQAFLSINIPPVPVYKPSTYPQQPLPAFLQRTSLPKPKRKPLPILSAQALSENVVVYGTGTTSKNNARGSSAGSSPPQTTSSLVSSRPLSPELPEQPKRTAQMEEHPHQWSSQLSTVMSESEDDMEIRLVSRSVSVLSRAPSAPSGTPSQAESVMRGNASIMSALSALSGLSGASNGSSGRRSSTGRISNSHLHNMPSISSSLAVQLEEMRSSQDPSPAFFRTTSPGGAAMFSPPPRTVRDIDEHGDGLADLQDMSNHPSRSGLSGFFTVSSNSVRNLHSSGSTHSLRSVGSGHFPSWVKVYYGKGEQRPWTANMSDQGDNYMTGANRQRPRDSQSKRVQHYSGVDAEAAEAAAMEDEAIAMDAADAGQYGVEDYPRRPLGLRRLTSSIWSPHLQMDRRAARFSVWEPPVVAWSDTTSRFDRRNMQVLLFTIGFVMPFSWMVAAFLPLPLDPKRAMEKRAAESEGEYGVSETLKQRAAVADENRYQSARWWRRLNRVMSVFGLLIITAIIALVVVSVEQHWGR